MAVPRHCQTPTFWQGSNLPDPSSHHSPSRYSSLGGLRDGTINMSLFSPFFPFNDTQISPSKFPFRTHITFFSPSVRQHQPGPCQYSSLYFIILLQSLLPCPFPTRECCVCSPGSSEKYLTYSVIFSTSARIHASLAKNAAGHPQHGCWIPGFEVLRVFYISRVRYV